MELESGSRYTEVQDLELKGVGLVEESVVSLGAKGASNSKVLGVDRKFSCQLLLAHPLQAS
jgi:hypothetical protein